LRVESASPDALCPELGATRAAVKRRLGAFSGPGWTARYTIGHTPEGSPRDFVRLELFGPDSTRQLARDLPLEAGACGTMSEVIALVLDRYFRVLEGHEPNVPGVSAAPPPAIVAPAESAPAAGSIQDTGTERNGSAGAERGMPSSLSLTAGIDQDAVPALGVRGLVSVSPWLSAGMALLVGLGTRRESLGEGRSATSRAFDLRAHVGWGPTVGDFAAYIGPSVDFSLERGSGSGLARPYVGYRAQLSPGLDAGVSYLAASWLLTVSGTLDLTFPALGGRFFVEDREVLERDPLRVGIGLGIGRRF
jgi:hypothetical protein